MVKDYSEEVKKILNDFVKKGFEFGKPLKLLSFKSGLTEEEIKKEIYNFDYLIFTDKQNGDEIRYALYFVYNKKKGRVFVITFRDKVRIITIYPLGQNSLKKYHKRKFKKDNSL